MTTRRRRTTNHWARKTPVTTHPLPKQSAPTVREPARDTASESHLGPYEATYDIARGYGFERAIVTP
jgi:hypothetical protein